MKNRTAANLFIQISIGFFLATFSDGLLYTVLPKEEIASQVGISIGIVGFVLGINRLVRLVFNQWVGSLYDRIPRRKIMIPAVALSALASCCYALSDGPVLIIIGRIIWGAAWSCLWIGSTTMVLDISTDENRGKMSGILAVSSTVTCALCALLAGFLCDRFGFRPALWTTVGMGLLNTVIWFFFLPETFPQSNILSDCRELSFKSKFPKKLYIKILCIGVSLFAVSFSYYGVIYATGILWLEHFFGDGATFFGRFIPVATLTGYFSAIRICVGAASAPLVGSASDRQKKRKPFLIVMLILAGAGTFMLTAPVFLLSLSGIMIGSFAVGSITALVYAWIGDIAEPGLKGKSIGIVNNVSDLGSALGPMIALNLVPFVGLFQIYSLLGIAFIFAIIMLYKV
ncbi:MAG: MFS transporter [Flexilinea sp.]